MHATIAQLADKMLGLFVPKITANADPCYTCSPLGGAYWGSNCSCNTINGKKVLFKQLQRCEPCGWVIKGCQPYGTC